MDGKGEFDGNKKQCDIYALAAKWLLLPSYIWKLLSLQGLDQIDDFL